MKTTNKDNLTIQRKSSFNLYNYQKEQELMFFRKLSV